MRVLAVLLLVANVLFFVWRFNAQLEDELAARRNTPPPPPASAPTLQLLRELPELPPLREAAPGIALPAGALPASGAPAEDAAADSAPSIADTAEADSNGTPGENTAVTPTPDDAATTTLPAPTSIASTDTALLAPPSSEAGPAAAAVAAPSSTVATPETETTSPETLAAPSTTLADHTTETAPPATVTPQAAEAAPADTLAAAPESGHAPAAPPPAATPATAPAALVPSGVCVRIGPFAQDADALRVSRWLRPRSSRLQIRHEGTGGRPLFGIYLEPRSASEREQNLRDLARQGVHDVLPVRREGMSHAISLGVFSSQENVNRRLAEIEKQGYRPIVVPRRDVGGSRYIEAELAAGFDDPARFPAAELGGAAVNPVTCRP